MHQFFFSHRQPVLEQLGMIAAVQVVGHADGGQSDGVIERPAFIRITFQHQMRALFEAFDDGIDALG